MSGRCCLQQHTESHARAHTRTHAHTHTRARARTVKLICRCSNDVEPITDLTSKSQSDFAAFVVTVSFQYVRYFSLVKQFTHSNS